ncbi:hypothetical protein OAR97_06150 [Arcobacteraceae bacterium]|nr:hypothetical protein [Arcobacteraceae bacterium]
MKNIFYTLIVFVLLMTGCSSKKYFEPNDTDSFTQNRIELNSPIIALNSNGATLENHNFIASKGIIENTQKNLKFLNLIEDTVLSADDNATIYLETTQSKTQFHFEKNIVSASKSKNLIAFGAIDNSITLYNTDTKEILFKEYLKASAINNVKIANPIFLNTVVLYPTLDGKIVIVDLTKKSIVKTINIDPKSDVNNIIFLKEVNNTLIAATSKKLFTFINGKVNLKDIDVQSVIVNKNNVYVATLDGQISKYDFSLQQLASQKFKFAKINALAFGTYLYALESQEFLIRISEDFKDVKIFNFSFDEEEKVIGIDDKIYFEDEYIILK